MKPIISVTDKFEKNKTPILLKNTSIPISNQDNKLDSSIPEFVPLKYRIIYQNIYNDLASKATIVVNNTQAPASNYIFETMKESLKKSNFKFSTFNLSSNDNITLISIISTITKLNPNTTLFKIIIIIIEYFINLILTNFTQLKSFFNNKEVVVYNPSNLPLTNFTLPNKYHHVNKFKKHYFFRKYQKLIFIYDKYDPYNYVEYIKIKYYCLKNKLQFHLLKNNKLFDTN